MRIASQDDAWPYAPASFASEKFIHASFRDSLLESASLYFPAGSKLEILVIDPRKLGAKVDIATTPRGEMPHIMGPIERTAVARILPIESFDALRFPNHIVESF